ncbi:uncharacterized protein LOC129939678 [Eupeodes corollae]|uniref:uncharacterized protein LOC129939678 n=1 Tax=Eupeodes corollae TaxID=290404 RepID=UPI0024937CB3|nr:uncharacterized protein LOC129939678 [Eupeodes corollae]
MADTQPKQNPSDNNEPNTEKQLFFDSKLFRWITLILYLGGVSGMGMVLSFYYLFFFDSTMPEIYLRFPVTIDTNQPTN